MEAGVKSQAGQMMHVHHVYVHTPGRAGMDDAYFPQRSKTSGIFTSHVSSQSNNKINAAHMWPCMPARGVNACKTWEVGPKGTETANVKPAECVFMCVHLVCVHMCGLCACSKV